MADANTKLAQGTIGATVHANPYNARRDIRVQDPGPATEIMIPFAVGGKKPNHHYHLGTIGYTAIKKGDEKRVRMLLRVLNYLAAPFGSTEREFLEFGTEGDYFTYDKHGFPDRTKQGKQQVEGLYSGLTTATTSPFALIASSFPGTDRAQDVKDVYAAEQKLVRPPIQQSDRRPLLGRVHPALRTHVDRGDRPGQRHRQRTQEAR